jgi:hypothetical protein
MAGERRKRKTPARGIGEMKKTTKGITRLELSHAYEEGKDAFEGKRRRAYNPYASTKQELAMAWWHGWDTAAEESNEATDKQDNENKDYLA